MYKLQKTCEEFGKKLYNHRALISIVQSLSLLVKSTCNLLVSGVQGM